MAKFEGEKIHDVFLSFRGEDNRHGFTSLLYATLIKAGIRPFLDSKQLQKGHEISASLLKAIELSRCSIVIFSEHYANSRWCLDELVKIMGCRKTTGHGVLPVFYHVDPRDVRKQTGAFGRAFERHRERSQEMEQKYRKALLQAANLSGWHVTTKENMSQCVESIVKDILLKIDNRRLFVADYPVGIGLRVQEIMSDLQSHTRSNDVLILGVWGMGGSGKTTIAKAIFNALCGDFDRRSFIPNIREAWKYRNGQDLQEQLISDIFGETHSKIHSTDIGINIIKGRLSHVKVLVLLDDMNEEEQLKALCRNRDWFAASSIIIITTRNKALLDYLEADYVLKMSEMENSESLELFSWHAFRRPSPIGDFIELSSEIVAYCRGLPLALEVLGSFLFNKRSIPVWEDLLSKLQRIPNGKVHEKLKISFDGLNDEMEKNIFLDICCFFIGKNKNYATTILKGCGLNAEVGITVLIERSLVKVNHRNNKLEMHDLLRDMGREIIRKKSPDIPGKRCRLWSYEDAFNVLRSETGTMHVEGLTLRPPGTDRNRIPLPTEAFKQMKSLRLLQLSHVKFTGKYDGLLEDLRWICWLEFAERYPPKNFFKGSLVAIDFRHSNLKFFCNVPQVLPKLKILNLSHSHCLRMTPDFSYMPNLERLILKDCPSLSKVHETIGNLNELRLVNFKDCKGLRDLPRSFYKLKSLEKLILSGSNIEKLEEDIEQMESLETLAAENTAITNIPFSIVRLKNIKKICLCGYEGLSCHVFPSLIWSWMSPSNIARSLAGVFVSISSLMGNNWNATNYLLPETTQSTSLMLNKDDSALVVSRNQVGISRSKNSMSPLIIEVGEQSIFQGWIADQSSSSSFNFDNHLNWPSYSNEGQGVYFEVPHVGCNLEGMILCIDYSCSQDNMASPFPFRIQIQNNTKGTSQHYNRDSKITDDDGSQWRDIVSNLIPGDEVEVIVFLRPTFIVKKTTIYLIYSHSNDKEIKGPSTSNKDIISIDTSNVCKEPRKVNPKRANLDNDNDEE